MVGKVLILSPPYSPKMQTYALFVARNQNYSVNSGRSVPRNLRFLMRWHTNCHIQSFSGLDMPCLTRLAIRFGIMNQSPLRSGNNYTQFQSLPFSDLCQRQSLCTSTDS